MIVRDRPSVLTLFLIVTGSVVPKVAPQIIGAVFLGLLVYVGHKLTPDYFPLFTAAPFLLIGLALSVFLGFRNSASYDRYWEGRKLWGQLVIDARTIARQCQSLIGANIDQHEQTDLINIRKSITYKTIAFSHALRHHLRDTPAVDDLQNYLTQAELDNVKQYDNKPNAIINLLALDIRACTNKKWLSEQLAQNMDDRLTSLASVLAACERIKNTPIPFAYTLLLHRTAYMYCFLLPFGLVDTVGAMTPIVVGIVSYTFFGLDALGDEIEEPFGELPNDLPLSAICRTIEINLKESLGETNIPEQLQPVDYCLL